MIRRLAISIAFLLGLVGAAEAQTCPVVQSTPAFTAGGSVFGRIAAQWNSYFAAKVDANNGVLCNPTIIGGPPAGTFTIAPSFSNILGTRNSGAQTIARIGSTLYGQLWTVFKSTSYTVNADSGGISDSGAILIATGAAVTFTLPNPVAGTTGIPYQFGSDGTHGFTLTTIGGAANIYGCAGAGSTSVAFGSDVDVRVVGDGAAYKCTSETSVGGATGANPTATAGATAVNGSASTFMRSDGAPPVAKASSSVFGIVEVDNSTITASGGVISAVGAVSSVANSDGTLTISPTSGAVVASVALGHANNWSGAQTFGEVHGTVITNSTTSRTVSAADCGKTILFTNASPSAYTTLNSILPGCSIAVEQGTGAGTVTITDGSGATHTSAHNYTKTFAAYSIIGIFVDVNSGGSAANYNITGDGA